MVTHDPNHEEKPSVTLEGIAAVLATVPSLLAASTEKDRQSTMRDALGMLSRACVMAGGKNGPPKEAGETSAESNDYVRGYNRAITDAHNAMADEFGMSSEDPNGIRAQTAIRRLYKRADGTATVPEGTSTPPSLLAENEKRFREEMAERLWTMLPAGQRRNVGLDDALREVAEAMADAKKWREREKTATDIHDAALEEAAARFDRSAAIFTAWQVRSFIRDLKSKAAPKPPLYEAMVYGTKEQADEAGRDHWAGLTQQQRDELTAKGMVPEAVQTKPAPVVTPEQARELDEHREAREEVDRRLDALATSDVHDFGWALAQMRAGKRVRRKEWATQDDEWCWWLHRAGDGTLWGRVTTSFGMGWTEIIATDWEVAE